VPLRTDRTEVTRVPVGRWVESPVPVRQEGDTTIVPVLEEVLVVEKRLMLKEEVRITRYREQRLEQQRITLRSEEVTVEREDNAGPEDPDGR
jgi:stress response protein YsnF